MKRVGSCPIGVDRCLLYLAAHIANCAGSCITGEWQEGCAVARKDADFNTLLSKITVHDFARMFGFTCRPMVGPGLEPLARIWPHMVRH